MQPLLHKFCSPIVMSLQADDGALTSASALPQVHSRVVAERARLAAEDKAEREACALPASFATPASAGAPPASASVPRSLPSLGCSPGAAPATATARARGAKRRLFPEVPPAAFHGEGGDGDS